MFSYRKTLIRNNGAYLSYATQCGQMYSQAQARYGGDEREPDVFERTSEIRHPVTLHLTDAVCVLDMYGDRILFRK
jgi:hypothetical protein